MTLRDIVILELESIILELEIIILESELNKIIIFRSKIFKIIFRIREEKYLLHKTL